MSIKPKYRRLTTKELEGLEKDFIQFLIINGVTADDWQSMKVDKPEAVKDMVTLFSDTVMESTLRSVRFLDYRSAGDLMSFQCLNDRMVLVGAKSEGSNADFSSENAFARLIEDDATMQVYTLNKAYKQWREQEIFEMIENGCEIGDGTLFRMLCKGL